MSDKIEKYIKDRMFAVPFGEKDLREAIDFGFKLALEQVEQGMKGMNVNGTINTIITKPELKKIGMI